LGERRGKEWSKCKKGSRGEQEGDVGGEGRHTNQERGPSPIKIDFLEFSLEGGCHFPRTASGLSECEGVRG
jgi:hypothetical protein